ncbi:hypothetical protein DSBG_2763 [Desulfosporosinus sp. BG]|nr:hypothetical protein DSBG_2763 [Desulfosporosinus sp. BG]
MPNMWKMLQYGYILRELEIDCGQGYFSGKSASLVQRGL